jgi:hypothetical protein
VMMPCQSLHLAWTTFVATDGRSGKNESDHPLLKDCGTCVSDEVGDGNMMIAATECLL